MSQGFSIADVPSLRAVPGGVSVDIGYLGKEDHLQAFIQIFAKFVEDNKDIIGRYQNVSVSASKPMASFTMEQLRERPKHIARSLYLAFVPEVRIMLQGNNERNELVVSFDNPSFDFANAF